MDRLEAEEKAKGFKTGLKRENGKSQAPEGSTDLECFLKQLEDELIKQSMEEEEKNNKSESGESAWAREVLELLSKDDAEVVVPTDKTNAFRTMGVVQYETGHREQPKAEDHSSSGTTPTAPERTAHRACAFRRILRSSRVGRRSP